MSFVKQLGSGIRRRVDSTFTRNLGWLSGGQAAIRVSRLAATVILPRFLTPHDYGLAALVLTTYEFTQTLTRIGVGAKIIQAAPEELEQTCETAYWLNWITFLAMFVLQCLVAFPIAWFYGDNQLILPICVLAGVFLFSPFGRVQGALLQRENRLKINAFSQMMSQGSANILTAIFAFSGMGMWAIVLPKLLVAPVEPIIYLKYQSWRSSGKFTLKHWQNILKFGMNFLGMNLLKTFRDNVDYLIVGRFVGVTELGVYYFAFNAGLGISLTIILSITTALYPYLCQLRSDLTKLKQGFFKSLKTIALVIIPFVALQSSLAPFYVPIVFGQEWVVAIPILILVCLSAIPRPFDSAAFHLLTAIDKPHLGLMWNVLFTVIFCVGLLIGVQGGIMGVAISVLAIHAIFVPIFLLWTIRYVFGGKKGLSNPTVSL